jgi:hypothetical protein
MFPELSINQAAEVILMSLRHPLIPTSDVDNSFFEMANIHCLLAFQMEGTLNSLVAVAYANIVFVHAY